MKVLVVGGAGYLGSIVTDLFLQNQQIETFVYEKFLFENEDVCLTKNLCDDLGQGWDIVIWTASQENDSYNEMYANEEIELMKILMKTGAHIIFCSTHRLLYQINVRNLSLEHYFTLSQMLRMRGMATEIYIPELYGPSQRMRWDTCVNSLIYSGFTDNHIIIGNDLLSRINIAPVLNVARKIYEMRCLYERKSFKSFEIYSNKFTMLELAFLIREAFNDNSIKVDVDVIKMMDDRSDYSINSEELIVENVSFKSTIANMKLQLEKGMFEDFQSDKYNNEIFLSSLVRGLKFLRKNKCQHTPPKQQ